MWHASTCLYLKRVLSIGYLLDNHYPFCVFLCYSWNKQFCLKLQCTTITCLRSPKHNLEWNQLYSIGIYCWWAKVVLQVSVSTQFNLHPGTNTVNYLIVPIKPEVVWPPQGRNWPLLVYIKHVMCFSETD